MCKGINSIWWSQNKTWNMQIVCLSCRMSIFHYMNFRFLRDVSNKEGQGFPLYYSSTGMCSAKCIRIALPYMDGSLLQGLRYSWSAHDISVDDVQCKNGLDYIARFSSVCYVLLSFWDKVPFLKELTSIRIWTVEICCHHISVVKRNLTSVMSWI